MEKYIKLNLAILFSIAIATTSCSIDEIEPINKLTEDNVVTNVESAEAMLNAAYVPFREFRVSNFFAGQMLYGGEMDLSFSGFYGDDGFDINDVQSDNVLLADSYKLLYQSINNVNFLIEQLELGNANTDESTKNLLIAEAKTIRAFSHFLLLREFGEHFDTSSQYGIVLRLEPAKSNVKKPRNSVAEVYDAIISDLQAAIPNGPSGIPHYRMSAVFAEATLAKVYLYKGDNANAASTAMSVINNDDGYALMPGFSDVFLNNWNSEVLFSPFGDYETEQVSADWSFGRYQITPSQYFRALADKQDGVVGDGNVWNNSSGYDNRFIYAFDNRWGVGSAGSNGNGKIPFTYGDLGVNTIIYFRLAELYLIFAEAEVRRGGDLSAALDKLNDIRSRAGMPLKTLSDAATLLNDIREEKMLELFSETGESLYDLVRYHKLGDINASEVKGTLTSENKMILPLPRVAMSGNDQLVQNPGYN